LLTCEQFLQELDDYMDPNFDMELKRWLESHLSECPSCIAVVDSTQKIMRLYKGVEPKTLPEDVKTRLLKALEKKIAARTPR
jgi:anti-sigma factor RsiW